MTLKQLLFIILPLMILAISTPSKGAWVWSRETGKFRNVDDLVRENSKAQFDYAEELEKKEDFRGAYREYQKLVKHFPDSILSARAQFRSARCLEKMERYSKAFEAYQVVIDKYPNFAEPETVLERQFAIAEMYYKGKKKGLPFLNVGLFSGKSDAVKFLDQIAKNAPFSRYAEKGKFMGGVMLEEMDRFEDGTEGEGAISAYKFVIERFPDGEFADDAQFRIGMCYYNMAKRSRHDERAFAGAIRNFRRYLTLYPNGEFAEQAKSKINEMDYRAAKGTYDIGRYYDKRGKIDAALIYYREVVQKYPLSEWAELAEARVKELTPEEKSNGSNTGEGS